MSETRADIAVVGAGPVGLLAGLALEDAGYCVTIVGPTRPTADARTSALLAGSIAFLERLEVWPALVPQSGALRTLKIIDATDRLIRAPEVSFESTEIGLAAFGYNVPNEVLLSELDGKIAQSGVIRRWSPATTISIGAEWVRIDLSDTTTVKCRLVVGADGRNSPTRSAAGISIDAWRYDQAALVVNVKHSLPHHDTSTEFHTATGPFTLVPLPGRCSSLVWVGSADETNQRARLSDENLAQAIELRSASILGMIEIDGDRQIFPLSAMIARRCAGKRVALVGEAVHVFPPIGAQGLNLGYRDVSTLVDLIAGPLPDPGHGEHLEAYNRARRRDIVSRTAAVDALNRTLLSDLVPVQGLRGFGLFLLDRLPALRRSIMRHGVAAV